MFAHLASFISNFSTIFESEVILWGEIDARAFGEFILKCECGRALATHLQVLQANWIDSLESHSGVEF